MNTEVSAALLEKISRLEQQLAAARAGHDQGQGQDVFRSQLAHELRNPLAPIIMASAMLAKLPGASAELLKLQAIIARQAQLLSGLLDQLQGSSGLQRAAGTPQLAPDPPGSTARRILLIEDNRDASDT
ncbi:MAG: histidine kinase dimerization/phospho-acceptor domain-containing protein, partial [Telluria sp.]